MDALAPFCDTRGNNETKQTKYGEQKEDRRAPQHFHLRSFKHGPRVTEKSPSVTEA